MKSSEFCYWLQGYFEISGKNSPLSRKQMLIIAKHIDLVTTFENENGKDSGTDYVDWLHNILKEKLDNPNQILTNSEIVTISNRLDRHFQHYIDPSYGDSNNLQDKLNKIHNGDNGEHSEKIVWRC